jgi:hypothetical protein
MKNILIIGLVSLVLFGVSAGLSVWLQTNAAKSPDSAHADEKKKKSADDHGSGGHGDAKATDKGHADPHKSDDKAKPAEPKSVVPSKDADRVEYRRLQMEVVASDMGGQMQDYDKLLKRVAVEMKLMAAEKAELDAKLGEIKQAEDRTKAADAKKGQPVAATATTQDNLTVIAGLFDNMPPEEAAAMMQAWTDGGKTDTAARVLTMMKPTKATKVLSAITDTTAKEAIFDRINKLKLTPPGSTP